MIPKSSSPSFSRLAWPLLAIAVILATQGCSSSSKRDDDSNSQVAKPDSAPARTAKHTTDGDANEKAESGAIALRDKKRTVERQAMKLELESLKIANAASKTERTLEEKREALAIAEGKRSMFDEMTAPQRRRDAELDLLSDEHDYLDAKEELEQLIVMYEGSELEDRTSEIVLERGRRQLALAEARLELRRRQNERLDRELELEGREKAHAVADARAALAAAERDAKAEALEHRIDRREAEDTLAKSREELTKLEKTSAGSEGDD